MTPNNNSQTQERIPYLPIEENFIRNPVYVAITSKTLETASKAYESARKMSITLFSVGIGLIIISVILGFLGKEAFLISFFGGLGATSIITLFLYRPIEKIQSGVYELIKAQIVPISLAAQYDILMRPLADSTNTSHENRWKISELMKATTSDLISLLDGQYKESVKTEEKNKQK
jgi:hypothetical protein